DVEQKLVWPLLTGAFPIGLQYSSADIAAKLNVRRLEIGKGKARKLYYPDYLIVLAGLPVMAVEAKAVGEPMEQALDEARLYANEINALFPHRINPVERVIACNGQEIWRAPVDAAQAELKLTHAQLSAGDVEFARFIETCKRSVFQDHVDSIRTKLRKQDYTRSVTLLGGTSFQDEELPQNTFGATIVG